MSWKFVPGDVVPIHESVNSMDAGKVSAEIFDIKANQACHKVVQSKAFCLVVINSVQYRSNSETHIAFGCIALHYLSLPACFFIRMTLQRVCYAAMCFKPEMMLLFSIVQLYLFIIFVYYSYTVVIYSAVIFLRLLYFVVLSIRCVLVFSFLISFNHALLQDNLYNFIGVTNLVIIVSDFKFSLPVLFFFFYTDELYLQATSQSFECPYSSLISLNILYRPCSRIGSGIYIPIGILF